MGLESVTNLEQAEPDREFFEKFLVAHDSFVTPDQEYYIETHRKRFLTTLMSMPVASQPGMSALEVGTYGLFPVALRNHLGYERVDGTIYEQPGVEPVKRQKVYPFDPQQVPFDVYDVDLERSAIPVADETYDFILAAEVIEHFAVDPNFFFFEANRILKPGGHILITTPNASCSENILRIMWRQVPHRYYQYRKECISDRHNLEYGPDLLKRTMENAGLAVEKMWTEYFWSEPRPEIEEMLEAYGYPTSLRGDDMLFLCTKVGTPQERFPDFLYV